MSIRNLSLLRDPGSVVLIGGSDRAGSLGKTALDNLIRELVEQAHIRSVTKTFPLSQANEALSRLRDSLIEGAAVLVPGEGQPPFPETLTV